MKLLFLLCLAAAVSGLYFDNAVAAAGGGFGAGATLHHLATSWEAAKRAKGGRR